MLPGRSWPAAVSSDKLRVPFGDMRDLAGLKELEHSLSQVKDASTRLEECSSLLAQKLGPGPFSRDKPAVETEVNQRKQTIDEYRRNYDEEEQLVSQYTEDLKQYNDTSNVVHMLLQDFPDLKKREQFSAWKKRGVKCLEPLSITMAETARLDVIAACLVEISRERGPEDCPSQNVDIASQLFDQTAQLVENPRLPKNILKVKRTLLAEYHTKAINSKAWISRADLGTS